MIFILYKLYIISPYTNPTLNLPITHTHTETDPVVFSHTHTVCTLWAL